MNVEQELDIQPFIYMNMTTF